MFRKAFVMLALLLPLLAGTAWAAPYDAKAFAEAQAAGKPIVVHIEAPWCTVCKAQRPVLAEMMKTSDYADLQLFSVDFDSQKDLLQKFGAKVQSTLIVFQGDKEVGRSSGDPKPATIKALVAKSKPTKGWF
jgi:thiol-disulfide isomerase/thioredoxin